jgi:hypothetical protein
MSTKAARRALVLIWFGFFLLNLAVVVWLHMRQLIERDSFLAAAQELNSLYAPYLGAIALFFFGTKRGPQGNGPRTNIAAALAVSSSLVWNLVVFAFIGRLVFQGVIEDSIDDVRFFGGLLTWLPAAAIGYFFGASALQPGG